MAGFNLPTDALPAQRLAARGESLAAFDERCIPAPPQRGCRIGTPALAALLLLQILPVLPPTAQTTRGGGPGSQSSRLAGGAGPPRGCRVGPRAPRSSRCGADVHH